MDSAGDVCNTQLNIIYSMKKLLRIVIPLTVAAAALILGLDIISGYSLKKRTAEGIVSLPTIDFQSLEGQWVSLTSFDPNKAVVVRYFHPECIFCQYEASEIAGYAELFSEIQVIMITADNSIDRISQFATEYNLYEIDNLILLIDYHQRFQQTFGKATLPSTYLYNNQHKLIKQFPGTTHPEAILKALTINTFE